MDRYKLLAVVFGITLAVIAVLWIADKARDRIRTRDIAAAQAKIDLMIGGIAGVNRAIQFGETRLLMKIYTAKGLPIDSAQTRQAEAMKVFLDSLAYILDSLVWEKNRITTDTLKMPERSKP